MNELSSEMTTGMSAPPIGITKSTPSASAAASKRKKPHIGSVPPLATNQTRQHDDAERDDRVDDLMPGIGDGPARS